MRPSGSRISSRTAMSLADDPTNSSMVSTTPRATASGTESVRVAAKVARITIFDEVSVRQMDLTSRKFRALAQPPHPLQPGSQRSHPALPSQTIHPEQQGATHAINGVGDSGGKQQFDPYAKLRELGDQVIQHDAFIMRSGPVG